MLTPARNAQAPVQHRECEGQESALFLSYFSDTGVCPGGVRYLEGGIESGFRKAETQEYKPRLLHVRKELKTLKSTEASTPRTPLLSARPRLPGSKPPGPDCPAVRVGSGSRGRGRNTGA
jgi:hypothetical protein